MDNLEALEKQLDYTRMALKMKRESNKENDSTTHYTFLDQLNKLKKLINEFGNKSYHSADADGRCGRSR